VIAPDISSYRERKLRLLNGPHTFSCGLALACGFSFVRQAMEDEDFLHFLHTLMFDEIIPVLTVAGISRESGESFAREVCDRFSNPFIDHKWKDITLQYSAKMRMRNVPLLTGSMALTGQVPRAMALGFAAYCLMMKPGPDQPRDEQAARVGAHWVDGNEEAFIKGVLSDIHLWGEDLSLLPGLVTAVGGQLHQLLLNGGKATLRRFNTHTGAV
jgi:tagaturonate reductase